MTPFAPTHVVALDSGRLPVMLVDGAAYTEAEWNSDTAADFERTKEGWTFQGQPFNGEVEALASHAQTESYEIGDYVVYTAGPMEDWDWGQIVDIDEDGVTVSWCGSETRTTGPLGDVSVHSNKEGAEAEYEEKWSAAEVSA